MNWASCSQEGCPAKRTVRSWLCDLCWSPVCGLGGLPKDCLRSSFTHRPGCGSEHCCAVASLPGLLSKSMVPWLGAAGWQNFSVGQLYGHLSSAESSNQRPFEVQVFNSYFWLGICPRAWMLPTSSNSVLLGVEARGTAKTSRRCQ